ncbi:hypothetical protein FS749_004067, partial [Ceratobasidium sp. UAMH 11750]
MSKLAPTLLSYCSLKSLNQNSVSLKGYRSFSCRGFNTTWPATRTLHLSSRSLPMDVEIPADDSSRLRVTSHHQYQSPSRLSPASVLPDPMAQFREWFKAASAPSETDKSRSVV